VRVLWAKRFLRAKRIKFITRVLQCSSAPVVQ
jgi:hypothetical protein